MHLLVRSERLISGVEWPSFQSRR